MPEEMFVGKIGPFDIVAVYYAHGGVDHKMLGTIIDNEVDYIALRLLATGVVERVSKACIKTVVAVTPTCGV